MSTAMPGGHKRSPDIEREYVPSRGRSFTSRPSNGYESLSNGNLKASSSNLNHKSSSNISPGSINGSPDNNQSTRAASAAATGKSHKTFGNFGFGGKLQNIVQSIAASSPKVHRRSQSADGRRRGHRSGGGGTNSSNEGLDLSVPVGSRVPAGDVSKANISAVFPRDARHQPGAVGIHNHGNTCFMNAIVQCLSNTEFLLEYFLSGDYLRSPSRRSNTNGNAIGLSNGGVTSRNLFQNGERVGALTERFAKLLKSIWACQYRPEISCGFKAIVGEYGSQYEGTSQNDSQEFLLWLLDKLHDDCASRMATILAKLMIHGKYNIHQKEDKQLCENRACSEVYPESSACSEVYPESSACSEVYPKSSTCSEIQSAPKKRKLCQY